MREAGWRAQCSRVHSLSRAQGLMPFDSEYSETFVLRCVGVWVCGRRERSVRTLLVVVQMAKKALG